MRYSKDKVINEGVRALLRSGAWVLKSTKRHIKLEHIETHHCITAPISPSDHRAAQNWLHQFRHHLATV